MCVVRQAQRQCHRHARHCAQPGERRTINVVRVCRQWCGARLMSSHPHPHTAVNDEVKTVRRTARQAGDEHSGLWHTHIHSVRSYYRRFSVKGGCSGRIAHVSGGVGISLLDVLKRGLAILWDDSISCHKDSSPLTHSHTHAPARTRRVLLASATCSFSSGEPGWRGTSAELDG